MTDTRIHCSVPFCTHTRKADNHSLEWICGEHWRQVPKAVKQAKFHADRRFRKKPNLLRLKACRRTWRMCVEEAVTSAAFL